MEQRRTKTLQRDTQRLISQFDGPSAQNVGENPRHVPWNTKNTEFEGRRQNMMGCSCMKAVVYEHNPYLHDRAKYYCTRHSGESPTRKSAKPAKKITKKETTVDPIRYLAVMKLARSVLAHKKKNSYTRRAI